MTGELRLERPTLKDEIRWGLQFFNDSVFDASVQVFERFETAVQTILVRCQIIYHAYNSIAGLAETVTATPMSPLKQRERRFKKGVRQSQRVILMSCTSQLHD